MLLGEARRCAEVGSLRVKEEVPGDTHTVSQTGAWRLVFRRAVGIPRR